jgi:hypothetical protein
LVDEGRGESAEDKDGGHWPNRSPLATALEKLRIVGIG